MKRLAFSGYTVIETLMVGGVVLALLRLAIPNYLELQGRYADATAQRNFHAVKNHLKRASNEPRPANIIFMLNQNAEQPLPPPLSTIQLDEGVKVHYAIHLKFSNDFDITALELSHDEGKHLFRLLEINDKGMEQIIRKGA